MSAAAKSSSAAKANAEFVRAEAAARFIQKKTKLRPKIALVLGSGLGAFADEFAAATRIPYAKIPHFPRSTAIGHSGQLVIGKVDGIEVAGMQGRVHLYEGYSAQDVAFPIRVFSRLGVKAVILTNAAGGIKKEFTQGRLVVINDHINLQGANPLSGPNADKFGPRFPDMTNAYDKKFRELTLAAGRRLGIGQIQITEFRNSGGLTFGLFDGGWVDSVHHLAKQARSLCAGSLGRPGCSVAADRVPPLPALPGAIDQHVGDCGTLLAPRSEPSNGRIPYRLSWLESAHLPQANLPLGHCNLCC